MRGPLMESRLFPRLKVGQMIGTNHIGGSQEKHTHLED